MDNQIQCSLKDITESFESLAKLNEVRDRNIDQIELEDLKKFHATRIQLNLEALRQFSEDYSNV